MQTRELREYIANSDKMILNMASASYSCRRSNSTGSMRTAFLAGTGDDFYLGRYVVGENTQLKGRMRRSFVL